ncbi:MAG: ATP-binding cassette domain-containing protein [Bacteroidetes bacterium]|nr:MAG: ATP-binding cassette domain-containing protein [Bacteroidota bacterium]
MSERILRALMQLFAIIAQVDDANSDSSDEVNVVSSSKSIRIIESFLKSEIRDTSIKKYVELFNKYLNTLHSKQSRKDGEKKRTSLNSVKILRICTQINEELTQKQKIIVLIRIIEFIQSNEDVTEQEIEFVNTVADSFNIDKDEYDLITDFILSSSMHHIENKDVMYVCPRPEGKAGNCIKLEGLDEEIRILYVRSVNLLFFRYFGKDELNLNGQFVYNDRTHIFTQGSTLRTQKSKPLYHSDILSHFLKSRRENELHFSCEGVEYQFKTGEVGIRRIDFNETSGNLIGIMGGSGTGKSTLLSVLNGNYEPTAGKVTINGIDLHKDKMALEGIIGFVSQDDLLIEELTVFQNLYFNAKLCFGNLGEREIKRKVIDVLYAIGLYEVKDLVVGSPLLKTISGGQRKRLNIALELIREPEVLFVDEPTSGLSSRDSELIMDLLKELTFKGKLVFVVIHQPSSDIFKMFDRLLIMDRGGYPVFDGNPIDAVVYFKTHIHHGNAEERECSVCGNVNPELIFNIIDSKLIDEYGNITSERKISPEEWYKRYQKNKKQKETQSEALQLKGQSVIASKIAQLRVFFSRDLLAKIGNRQYVLITFLEAPLLAFLLSFVVKFFNRSDEFGNVEYSFYTNENIPQFMFISVVVSLFLGLTVSAEEIFKDKHILKRESFLNLSRGSYLTSKILILFLISAVQSLSYVLVSNMVLEIHGLWFEYWLILFSTSCVANVMGLNISSAFNSAKVIYIIVPILIIPQLLFSGVIVKFDRLHPAFSSRVEVPWIGNLMPSRWAYEAMAVSQVNDNPLGKDFYLINRDKTNAAWKKDYWLNEMKHQLSIVSNDNLDNEIRDRSKIILLNEIKKEEDRFDNFSCVDCTTEIEQRRSNKAVENSSIEQFLEVLRQQYNKNFNLQVEKSEKLKSEIGIDKYNELRNNKTNEALIDQTTNRLEKEKLVIENDEIFRKDAPVFYENKDTRFLDAPFYAPFKYSFGYKINTFWANIIVLWIFVGISYIALYYNIFERFLNSYSVWKEKRFKN